MTVATTQSQTTILGNGSTTSFVFNFIGVAAADIYVIYNNGTTLTPLAPSSYTLVLNPPATNQIWGVGGTVTYLNGGLPIPNGTQLIIGRTVPLLQSTSLTNQGDLWPTVIEAALDTLCFEIQQISNRTGQIRGIWQTATAYSYGDFVQDGPNGANTQNYYMCAIANTSGTWSTDLASGDWSLAIDVQQIIQYRDQAAASAAAALVSQIAAAASAASASSSASTATTQAGIATTQATAAAVSAAAAASYAASYSGTSTTSLGIGTGAKTFTTQASKLWVSGQFLQIASNASALNYMHGTVTSYSGTSLVMNITDIGGSGTHADWNISISGTQGPGGGGGGTVTSVSVASANGFSGTVSSPTTTPSITMSTSVSGILKGNGTAISAATPGTDYLTVLSGDVATSGNVATIKTNVALAGSPTTTTQSLGDNSTKIATTAFVAANGPIYNGGTTSGTANAQIASATGFTLIANHGIVSKMGDTNTGAMTLNVNGTGSKNVYVIGPAGPVSCVGGEAVVGNVGIFVYDGTEYQLINSALAGAGGGSDLADVNFSVTGGVCTIIGVSNNVSSVIYNAVGDYTINFSSAVPNANYGCTFGAVKNTQDTSTNDFTVINVRDTTNKTVNSVRITSKEGSGGGVLTSNDPAQVYVRVSEGASGGAGGSGKFVQQLYTENTNYVQDTVGGISYSDTIPQNTQGTEILTQVITPTNASNLLTIQVTAPVSANGSNRICLALFQDSTANALSATALSAANTTTMDNAVLTYEMVAGTTSPTTFHLRFGDSSANDSYLNGNSGGRIYGGVQRATMIITETIP